MRINNDVEGYLNIAIWGPESIHLALWRVDANKIRVLEGYILDSTGNSPEPSQLMVVVPRRSDTVNGWIQIAAKIALQSCRLVAPSGFTQGRHLKGGASVPVDGGFQ